MATEVFLFIFLFTLIALLYYFHYYRPKAALSQFFLKASTIGYKTKLLPFQFLKYYIAIYFKKDDCSLQILKKQWSQYDIIVGNIFSSLGVMIAKPQLIKDVCNQMGKFQKSPFVSEVFHMLNGGGIVFSEGDVWRRKRRIISSVFHYDFLNNMIPVIQEEMQQSFKEIDQLLLKGMIEVDIRQIMTKVLSNVVAKCFFGTDMKDYLIEGRPYCKYYVQFLDEIGAFMPSWEHIMFGMWGFKLRLTPKSRLLRKKYDLLQKIAREITQKQVEKIKAKKQTKKNILTALYQNNLLTLQGKQNPQQYTMSEVVGEFFAFFAAGTDTTANVINLALHYLTQHKQWTEKIFNEYTEVKKLNLSMPQQLKQLKVCDAIFNQTLRINGPVSILITRRAKQNLTIGGNIHIQKGTYVTVSPLICHYRRDNFEDSKQFMPERWLKEQKLQPFSYVPFGGGERNCIGQYLARIQAKLILSRICERYVLEAIHPIKMTIKFIYITGEGSFRVKRRREEK